MASPRRKGRQWVKKPHGEYVWEDLRDPPASQVQAYRTIRQGDHVVRIAILRNGKTVATSVGHPKTERKAERKKRKR